MLNGIFELRTSSENALETMKESNNPKQIKVVFPTNARGLLLGRMKLQLLSPGFIKRKKYRQREMLMNRSPKDGEMIEEPYMEGLNNGNSYKEVGICKDCINILNPINTKTNKPLCITLELISFDWAKYLCKRTIKNTKPKK